MSNTKTSTLTVAEAEREYRKTARSIRRWATTGKVKAEKTGNNLMIDRASLEAHLAANPCKENTATHDEKVNDVPAPVATPLELENDIKEENPQVDLLAAATTPLAEILPPLKPEVCRPQASPSSSPTDTKEKGKSASPPDKRKFKKGPVRFAKDAMRHLDIPQMQDVCLWLNMRINHQRQTHKV